MKYFAETVSLRRRELLALWVLFCVWAFSQYMYRYAHQGPYDLARLWEYTWTFSRYIIGPWLVTVGLAFCGYVVGRPTIKALARGFAFRSDLEEAVYSIGIGLGIISIATFLIGLAGLLYPFIFAFLSIVVLAAGFRHLIHLFRTLKKAFSPQNWDLLDAGFFLLVGLFVLIAFLNASNPSTGYDAINSHLCAPKYYLRDHAVSFYTWINFNNFPQVQEMLLTLEMMVFKDPGASLIYLSMLGIAVVTYMIGERYLGRRVGMLGLLLTLLIEKIQYLGQGAMVEHLLGFYVILLVHGFLAWYESRDSRWLVLMGIVSGLACGVKYTALVTALLVLIMIVVARFLPMKKWERQLMAGEGQEFSPSGGNPGKNKRDPRGRADNKKKPKVRASKARTNKKAKKRPGKPSEPEATGEGAGREDEATSAGPIPEVSAAPSVGTGKAIGIILLWTVIIASPWYIRNIVLFGNPFFPFFESIFGGLGIGTLNEIRNAIAVDHAEMLKYFGFTPTLHNLLALPWNFTFHNNGPWLWQDTPGPVGPFLLAFTVAVLFVRKWRRAGVMIIIYLALYYSYWFLLERMEDQRYMTSAYPLHALLGAWGLSELLRLEAFNARNRMHLTWLIIIVALSFGFFYRTGMNEPMGTTLAFTDKGREVYLRGRIPAYDVMRLVNEGIASGHEDLDNKTIIYGLATEDHRYYFDCPLYGGIFGFASHFEFMEHASTGQELYDYLHAMGCKYLLYNAKRSLRMSYALTVELPEDETFEERFQRIARMGDVYFYRLMAPGEKLVVPTEEEEEVEYETPEGGHL